MIKDTDSTASLSKEIANRERASFSFAGINLSLPNPDPVLKKIRL